MVKVSASLDANISTTIKTSVNRLKNAVSELELNQRSLASKTLENTAKLDAMRSALFEVEGLSTKVESILKQESKDGV